MSQTLENILKELETLTAEESLILLNRLGQHLQRNLKEKGEVSSVQARLDWQSANAEEIIASLKASRLERELEL